MITTLKARLIAAGLVVAVIAAAWLYVSSLRSDLRETRDALAISNANVEALELALVSERAAAAERQADTETNRQQEQELSDARHNATSDDDRRLRRGCLILRQQGADSDALPAACRSAGGS